MMMGSGGKSILRGLKPNQQGRDVENTVKRGRLVVAQAFVAKNHFGLQALK
jgi:hypothetical protein